MKTQAGVWIDHQKAVIVMVTDTGEEIRLLISSVEKQLRRAGDSPLQGICIKLSVDHLQEYDGFALVLHTLAQ